MGNFHLLYQLFPLGGVHGVDVRGLFRSLLAFVLCVALLVEIGANQRLGTLVRVVPRLPATIANLDRAMLTGMSLSLALEALGVWAECCLMARHLAGFAARWFRAVHLAVSTFIAVETNQARGFLWALILLMSLIATTVASPAKRSRLCAVFGLVA